jgi:hypothetical protein
MKYHIRQGDVLLIAVDAIPENATAMKRDARGVVLLEGEATGHAHRFIERHVKQFSTPTKARFLKLVKTSNLLHEEHTKHAVPPGVYRMPMQAEYSPKELIRVAD